MEWIVAQGKCASKSMCHKNQNTQKINTENIDWHKTDWSILSVHYEECSVMAPFIESFRSFLFKNPPAVLQRPASDLFNFSQAWFRDLILKTLEQLDFNL